MRQVPHRHRPGGVRRARQPSHVVHAPAAVVDVRQHQHGDALIQRRLDRIRRNQPDLVTATKQRAQSLRHIQIGREIPWLRQDYQSFRSQGQPRGQRLEQVHRGAVARHRAARLGADQLADLLADAQRQRHPAVAVPRPDQLAAPLALHHFRQPRFRRPRQRAERIAVQIDHSVRQLEQLPEPRQRIGAIERVQVAHAAPIVPSRSAKRRTESSPNSVGRSAGARSCTVKPARAANSRLP